MFHDQGWLVEAPGDEFRELAFDFGQEIDFSGLVS